ncbi:uncharacterized protein G2W53_003987 [Senna tora]|uniref:Uncharacterized protein n=1 Tax=Senna tora TaxID=362788 RepID=A0A834XB38_9FABA|nr:uncharacterized protein G2W53_003987 [Senna tora]
MADLTEATGRANLNARQTRNRRNRSVQIPVGPLKSLATLKPLARSLKRLVPLAKNCMTVLSKIVPD